jgi:hypothetical protein
MRARSSDDSTNVSLCVLLDHHGGEKSKWPSAWFTSKHETVQAFIEAHAIYQAFRGQRVLV